MKAVRQDDDVTPTSTSGKSWQSRMRDRARIVVGWAEAAVFTDDETAAGAALLSMDEPVKRHRWVTRRVDSIDIIDERTMHRTVTLELELDAIANLPRIGDRIIIPAVRLTRGAHAVLETQSVVGERVNRMNERRLVGAGLHARWRSRNTATDEAFVRLMNALTTSAVVPEAWADSPSKVARSGRDAVNVEQLRARHGVVHEMYFRESERELLQTCLRELVRWQLGYLLLIAVPGNSLPHELTFSYLEALPHDSFLYNWSRVAGEPTKIRRELRRRTVGSSARSAIGGTYSWNTQIPLNGAGESQSYHAVLCGPPGFQVVDAGARIAAEAPGAAPDFEAWVRDDDLIPTTAHVYLDFDGARLTSADLFASFYSFKTGLLAESIGFTAVACLIHETFFRHLAGFDHRISEAGFDPNFAATLVLLVPALLVAAVGQRDSHRIGSKSFWALRICLAIIATMSLVGALTFALKAEPATNRWVWQIVRWGTFAATARIWLGFVIHWYRSSLRTASHRAAARWMDDRTARKTLVDESVRL